MTHNTVSTQLEQLRHGFTRIGTGPRVVLIQGSCRSVPYLNFMQSMNLENKLSIYFIDPFYFNYNTEGKMADLGAALAYWGAQKEIRDLVASTEWYVHEYYESYGMFNSSPDHPQNIYKAGMKPKVDLTIPNYHNYFILFQDLVTFHDKLGPAAREELTRQPKLSVELQAQIKERGLEDVEKFCGICDKSSFPEFGLLFRADWMHTRYFYTCNHVSSSFTATIFGLICQRLEIPYTQADIDQWKSDRSYSSHVVPLTEYDLINYGITWGEPLQALHP